MVQLKKILCPVDFSDCSKLALDEAMRMAESFGAELTVLHCFEGSQYVRPDLVGWTYAGEHRPLREIAQDDARAELAALRATVGDPKGVHWRVEEGTPVETILEESNAGLYDLIVVGTHGRTGLTHLLLGSVAERIVRSAACPVLTLRSRKQAA